MTSVAPERGFEKAIECALLQNGPDACPMAGCCREAGLTNT
jgi:hypothetical protein